MKNVFFASLFLVSLCCAAATLPPELKIEPTGQGAFNIGGFKFEIITFNQKWHNINNRKWKDVKTATKSGGMVFDGVILFDGCKGTVSESIMPVNSDRFSLEAKIDFQPALKAQAIVGSFSVPLNIPLLTIDGKELKIPAEFEKQTLYSGKPREIILQGLGAYELVITDAGQVMVQDNRKLGGENGSIRFYFQPGNGEVGTTELKLNCELRRFKTKTVPLASLVNRPYRDEPDKVGWSAQGADHDLRMFTPGNYNFEGIPFDLTAPGAVAVGGSNRGGVPAEIVVPLSDVAGMKAINLAHTSAWTPAGDFGEMIFTYDDNSTQTVTLSGSKDCGDWARPANLGNAIVAWEGNRPTGKVGFYLSSFPLPRENPVSVTFRSTSQKVLWFIQGVTFSEKPLRLPIESTRKSQIVAGKDWVALEFNNYPVAGSALDFSGQLDAPAGKYGFAKAMPDGTLRFENAPERRLKLFGTNLCQTANYPGRETAIRMAEIFERTGYNSVRFHHHDDLLVKKDAPDSVTLDPETLERFDFFFAELKKRGFYMTTDLYTSRKFKPGDNIPNDKMNPKALFPVSAAAMDNWKAFARNWMTHRNPYTGLTYAEDPALVMVNLVNEDNLSRVWSSTVESRDFYTGLFEEYKKQHNLPEAKADNVDPHFRGFLVELQNKSLAEMRRFLKEELKMKTLITSLNFQNSPYQTAMRDRFDLVDMHGYHDHPAFLGAAWRSKTSYQQTSTIGRMGGMIRGMMTSRINGKPFLVTEFNFCYPNHFRSEGGPLVGGYASLQDWDGLYRFCYSHNIKRIEIPSPATGSFESVNDPVMQLSDRMIHSLFLRGDAAPASRSYSVAIPNDIVQTDRSLSHSLQYQMLGLTARIGAHMEGAVLPVGIKSIKGNDFADTRDDAAEWQSSIDKSRVKSSNGEISLDGKKTEITINTPKTESVTLLKGQLSTGGVLSVNRADTFQTVAAISLDNQPLASSRRILVLQITDVLNSGTVFQDSKHKVIENKGQLPLLLRRGRADISLKLSGAERLKVTALSADGAARGEISAQSNNGVWSFTADIGSFPGGVMAYELTR